MRGIWTMSAATVVCLALVGLVDAGWYSRGGGAMLLAAITVALVILTLVRAPRAAPKQPGTGETVILALIGMLLTVLFWFRARVGLRSDWLVELELLIPALFGWAWPALFLVLFYRRPGEGWRPDNRRRFVWLTGAALVAGAFGYLLHVIAWQIYQERPPWHQSELPTDFTAAIIFPTQTPRGLSLLGRPQGLELDPPSLRTRHPMTLEQSPQPIAVTALFPLGIKRNVSWQVQGTQVQSSNRQVVEVSTDDQGQWQLQPKMPGPAIVSVNNRGAQAYIGVWVTNRHGEYRPFTVVTNQFKIASTPAHRRGDEHFHSQTLKLTNTSGEPVLGPIHAVFHIDQQRPRVALQNARRSQRLMPDNPPYITAFPASPGNPAPVLAPGQTIEFEIKVVPPLTGEWLHFNLDLIQAITPP